MLFTWQRLSYLITYTPRKASFPSKRPLFVKIGLDRRHILPIHSAAMLGNIRQVVLLVVVANDAVGACR
jgi:hypothetical protein